MTHTRQSKTRKSAYNLNKSNGILTHCCIGNSLWGGAIAGIVIGSVAVTGIGGFAFLWFAVKKKTFADLIAAIKALFTKKK